MIEDNYEDLLNKVKKELPVIECDLIKIYGDSGYYRDGVIYIEKSLPTVYKKEILLEEYAHHKTTVGIILDQTNLSNRKQEKKARTHSYEINFSLDTLIDCYLSGVKYYWECAEYLDYPEEFIFESVQYMKRRLGTQFQYKTYQIKFVTDSALEVKVSS